MLEALIRKLEQHGPLTDEERDALAQVTAHPRSYGAREDIVREGDRVDESLLLIEGFAIRHNHLPDGRRQITAVHIPGDFADLHGFLLKKVDDGVASLTRCTIAAIPHSELRRLSQFPHLARVLWFSTLVDGAVHRAWMIGLGAMDAHERLARFLCEFHDRLESVGLTQGDKFRLPITQEELADVLGTSNVHVNRMLQELRSEGLITSEGRDVRINDFERLKQLAQYDPGYLHFGQRIERY